MFLGKKSICCYCNRSFAYASNLSTHRHVYHEGKRVQCPICSKLFTRRYNVRRHMARNHQDHHIHTQVQNKTDLALIPNPIAAIVNTNNIYQQHHMQNQNILNTPPYSTYSTNTSTMDFDRPTNPYGFPSLIECFSENKLN